MELQGFKLKMNTSPITIIRKSNSWNEFNQRISKLTNKQKGDCFEALTKYYLLLHPTYASKLGKVWYSSEVPRNLKTYLNLPDNDEGIDLIAETKDGGYWAIQCKYRSNELKPLTRHNIDTFISLSLTSCKNFELALVCTTADRFSHKLNTFYGNQISLCCGDVWRDLGKDFFQRLHSYLDGQFIPPRGHQPRRHQQDAIDKAHEHFVLDGNTRGKLIMPCGSGKSLTSYWMARSLGAEKILLAVPSLGLMRQSLEAWANESQAAGHDVEWICVCSDPSVKDVRNDDSSFFTQDLGILVHTDPDKIADWLKKTSDTTTLVITTYQSGTAISEACRKVGYHFDLGIFDEAHKTVGKKGNLFGHLLFDENINIRHRLFMTATERRYRGNSDEILSMEDPEVYGDTVYLLSFKEALECQPPILNDYKIVAIAVNKSEVAKFVRSNALLNIFESQMANPEEARTLAIAITLRKILAKYSIRHCVSFHSSVNRAKHFMKINDDLTAAFPRFDTLDTFHVSGRTPTSERSRALFDFATSSRALVSNARCLTEGIDVPGIDCVVFADPKKSAIDVVQAAGRALRIWPGKEFGFIMVPIFIDDDTDLSEPPDDSRLSHLLSVLRALAANDERIIEYFRDVSCSKRRHSEDDLLIVDVLEEQKVDRQKFVDSLDPVVLSKLQGLSWKPFEEAREFAHSLGFQSRNEWFMYCRGGFTEKPPRPKNISANPDYTYKLSGWSGWGDWLGTGRIANQNMQYRSFEDARDFSRSLGLKTQKEWEGYCAGNFSEKPPKPNDIPATPKQTYQGQGWFSFGDWLGTGYVAPQNRKYRQFKEAREFARSLGLQSKKEWFRYSIGEFYAKPPKPEDIPGTPSKIYQHSGWVSWGDWLGTGLIATFNIEYRSFEDAREFVRALHLKDHDEWKRYCKGKLPDKPPKPEDIPSTPYRTYKDIGWSGFGDWLGTGRIASQNRRFIDYEKAREFVRNLKLKSKSEWSKYSKGELTEKPPRPDYIPGAPSQAYKYKGWISWADWLGTTNVAPRNMKFVDFEEAKEFARKLKLKSQKQWLDYCRGNVSHMPLRPDNIPTFPDQTYRNKGWIGWGDWLGTGNIAGKNRLFLDFDDARAFVRSLRLKSSAEWAKYCKNEFSDKPPRPQNLPTAPYRTYADKWSGWNDWLGVPANLNQSD